MKYRSIFCTALLVLLIHLLVFTTGCTDQDQGPSRRTESPLPKPGSNLDVFDSPASAPTSVPIDLDARPAPGKAILRGRIQIEQSTALIGELFLAKAVPTSDPEIDLLELDEQTAPKALIDRQTGEFIFTDIEPGKYGLIVWEPLSSMPVRDPGTGQTLFVELSADQVMDAGKLSFP